MLQTALSFDHQVFQFINRDLANPFFDVLMPVLRNRFTWIPVYIFIGFYTLWKYQYEAWKFFVLAGLTFFLSDFINYHLWKPLFHRQRPCYDLLIQVRLVLGDCGGKWSFPSSHAANHFALSLSFLFSGLFGNKLVKVLVFLWPFAVGFAQVYVGVHYPADILIGYAWGIFCASISYAVLKRYF